MVKICGALSMKDVVGWNEDTGAVAIEDADRRLEGKAVYDTLFLEAADYVLMQSLSGNAEKVVEMDVLLKEAQKYAARYENEPEQQREGHAAEISEAEPTGERREENHPDAEQEKRTEELEQEETVRFTVTETSDAFTEPYAVWDSETQDYYATGDGTVPTFDTSMPLQSLMRYGTVKRRIIMQQAMAQCRHLTHRRKQMFSAISSMKVLKQRIYRKQGRKKQKILHQSRKMLQRKRNSRER